jgi:hypothetical protein
MRPPAGRELPSVRSILALLALLALAVAMGCDRGGDSGVGGDEASPAHAHGELEVSATGKAKEAFTAGLIALHCFCDEEARDHFHAARQHDPAFGMAYWGEAMTYDNALGTSHRDDNEERGEEVIQQMQRPDAQGALHWNELENGFADAVRQRFHPGWDGERRRLVYAEAMSQLSARYPDNDEVTAFTALAIMALPGFDRDNPAHVTSVTSRLEEVPKRNPNHPGALHYLIHLYDNPGSARQGLQYARRFAEMAPPCSHARHMPSHLFGQLGMWEEVAASNEKAYEASVTWQKATARPLHVRDFHALEWLLGAYVKLGRMAEAGKIIEELDAIETQIKQRNEPWGDLPDYAKRMRAYAPAMEHHMPHIHPVPRPS